MTTKNSTTDAAIAEFQAKAETAITQLLGSDDWSAWIRWASRFHQYSFINQCLIFSQCPTASQVAGFNAWLKVGRAVRKGEKAIRIFAPMICTRRDENAEGERETFIRYRLVSVFDLAQTDGDPIPAHPGHGELTDDNPAVIAQYDTLKAALIAKGISVTDAPAHPTIGGRYHPGNRSITVNDTPNAAKRLRVLLHEAAHALADHDARTVEHDDAEVQAELAAHVAAAAIGFDTSAQSIAYVAGWALDPKRLKANAAAVAKLAKALIALFPTEAGEGDGREEQADRDGATRAHLERGDTMDLSRPDAPRVVETAEEIADRSVESVTFVSQPALFAA